MYNSPISDSNLFYSRYIFFNFSQPPVHPIRKAAQLIYQALSSSNSARRIKTPVKSMPTTAQTQYDAIKSPCNGEKTKPTHYRSTFSSSKLCTYFPLRLLRYPPKPMQKKQFHVPVRERSRRRKITGDLYHQRLGKTLVLAPNGLIKREGVVGDSSSSKSSSMSSSYFTRRCLSERREHARMRSVKVTVEPQEVSFCSQRLPDCCTFSPIIEIR